MARRIPTPRAGPIQVRPALFVGAFLGGIAMLTPAAYAVDGVWTGPGGEWTTGTNWSSTPTVPDNTATFTNNGAPTSVTVSGFTSIATLQFNAAAPAYSFTVNVPVIFTINGSGIVNGSAFAPTIVNSQLGFTDFTNSSGAGNANIVNSQNGVTRFFNTSSAATASIVNNQDGFTEFIDGSSAGSATIVNNAGTTVFVGSSSASNASIINNQNGVTGFQNSSNAGTATIVNDGVMVSNTSFGGALSFSDSATAGSATISNRNNGQTSFFDTSTAGNATIVNSNNGPLDLSSFLSGGTYFFATNSAGNATIVNNSGGITYFGGTSSAANATITNNGGTTYFFASSSAGNATIVNNAGGTVDISGLTSGGTPAGSIAGAGTYFLGSKQLTVGSNNLSTTVSGVIADGGIGGGTGGSLVKVGGGTLTLSGNNTYTGGTVVNAGSLVVNGSLASGVTVNSGGTLGGSGSVGGLTVNGGTVAPGSSIGTLTVNGSFAQGAGSTYQVEVNSAGQSDKIAVSGTAAISGGTVQVLAQSGTYARNTTYTILSATGGVSGAYSSVTSNFAFLTPSLSYDANNVYLLLFQPVSAFAAGAQTANQRAVGTALDFANPTATGDFAAVLNALSVLSTAQGPAALTAISGQNYAGFSNAMVQGAQLFLNNFAAQAGGGNGSGSKVTLAEACDVACDTTSPALWGAWGGALGGLGTIAGNGNTNTLTYNVGGFAAGLDRRVLPTLLVGIAAGYQAGTQWVGGFDGRGTTDTVQAALYSSFTEGPLYVDAIAGYAYSANQMWRNITIPGLQPRTARGLTGANQFYGQVETGYRFDIGGVAAAFVTPFARLQAYTGTQNAFTETGAQSLNLNVAAQITNSLRSVIGAQLGGAMDMGWRERLAAQFRLGWSHEYADTARPVSASFAGAPTVPFTTFGAAPQRDGVVLGFSASTAIAQVTSAYLRYEGEIAGQDSSHALIAGVRMTW